MTAGNPVATIADDRTATIVQLAPKTMGWLQVPLTPSRAAALAAFTARTGISAERLAADLIDDVVFNKRGEG